MQPDQSARENDLFPIATPRWVAARARARRRAKRAHFERLTRLGVEVKNLAEKWTEDYFQSLPTQERLF